MQKKTRKLKKITKQKKKLTRSLLDDTEFTVSHMKKHREV